VPLVDDRLRLWCVPLSGPGGRIRFGVGDGLLASTTWGASANKRTDDVYVSIRVLAGVHKFSLHQRRNPSGAWRYSFTEKEMQASGRPPEERIIHAWNRPEPDEDGVRPGPHVVVPPDDVVTAPLSLAGNESIEWAPIVADRLTILRTMFWTPNKGRFPWCNAGMAPLGGFFLASGDVFLVGYNHEPMEEWREELAQVRSQITPPPPEAGIGRTPEDLPRTIAWVGGEPDEYIAMWDLALPVAS